MGFTGIDTITGLPMGDGRELNTPMVLWPRNMVYAYVKDRLDKTDTHVVFNVEDVYVVWFCKTLQNWKALVSTTLPDGMYYEVTFNGDKKEVYIDSYKKVMNEAFTVEGV